MFQPCYDLEGVKYAWKYGSSSGPQPDPCAALSSTEVRLRRDIVGCITVSEYHEVQPDRAGGTTGSVFFQTGSS